VNLGGGKLEGAKSSEPGVVVDDLAEGAERRLRVGRRGESPINFISFEINRVEAEIADEEWDCERRTDDSAAGRKASVRATRKRR